MSWDQASLTRETARLLRCDDWETIERGQNGSFLLKLASFAPVADANGRGHGLSRRPTGPSEQSNGEPSGSVGVPVVPADQHRLIPSFRNGDRRIAAGRDLFSIGSSGRAVFNLLDGWVAVYTLLEDGRRQIVQFAMPGAILGVLPSKGGPATVGAQALTDVVVSVIPMAVLTSQAHSEPEIGMRLALSLARDCNLAFDHLTSVGRRSARERVAHLLLELFTRFRAQWPGHRSEEMVLPLTQEQIGDATGLTFVHVNRVLSALRKEGIVQFHYRRLRILDPDRLIEVAGVDPEIALAWLERRPWI